MTMDARCDHDAMKQDEARWAALDYVGRQYTPRDTYGPEEHLEMRNCDACHSTLAKVVSKSATHDVHDGREVDSRSHRANAAKLAHEIRTVVRIAGAANEAA